MFVSERDVSLGMACDNSTTCTHDSACIDGVCTCPSNGAINDVLQRCVASDVRFIGDQCEKSTDCYTNNEFLIHNGIEIIICEIVKCPVQTLIVNNL